MKTETDLLRRVFGSEDIKRYDIKEEKEESSMFTVLRISIPAGCFAGTPRDWWALVLSSGAGRRRRVLSDALLKNARELMRRAPSIEMPVLFVSEVQGLSFREEFQSIDDKVFVIDASDFGSPPHETQSPAITPFGIALRRRLASGKLSPFHCPYDRQNPVCGWRFFGRRREIDTVLRSLENFAIVGGRRIGKSSLLKQLEKQLADRGFKVLSIDGQYCRTEEELVSNIMLKLSAKDLFAARQHASLLGQNMLLVALQRLLSSEKRLVLVIDELGNLLEKRRARDWPILGVLRSLSQQGRLRVIFSSFQELPLLQQADYAGPAVHFASILRLGAFSDSEVEELVLGPLDTWRPLTSDERRNLRDLVVNAIGGHPFFLQHFCADFFAALPTAPRGGAVDLAKQLVRRDMGRTFHNAMEDVFYNFPDALPKYLFLRKCGESSSRKEALRKTIINEQWIEETLLDLGLRSTLESRLNLMGAMELPGYTQTDQYDRTRQLIAAPIIYSFLKQIQQGDISRTIEALKQDALREAGRWHLDPVAKGAP